MPTLAFYSLNGVTDALLERALVASDGLVAATIGAAYAPLHSELAAALGQAVLDPAAYRGDFAAYTTAWHTQMSILSTEAAIRRAALVFRNRSPDSAADVPLLDGDARLVNLFQPPVAAGLLMSVDDALRAHSVSSQTPAPPPAMSKFEGFPDHPPLITSPEQVLPVMNKVVERFK